MRKSNSPGQSAACGAMLLFYKRTMRRLISIAIAAVPLVSSVTFACTSFVISTSDGGRVYARTMEFAVPLQSRLILIPRHLALEASMPAGAAHAKWEAKYAAIGMNGLGIRSLVDGMNEKGLAGGILYFPGGAKYADPAHVGAAKAMAPWDLLTWALTRFSNVAELRAALPGVALVDIPQKDMGFVPPVHFTFHDDTGASVVIEPINGQLKAYDNPVGVLTNSPSFEWHMTNLRNYLHLSTSDAPGRTIAGVQLKPFGQGSGLQGIPGDPTPPSRFVRAIGYTTSVKPVAGGEPSVRLAEHIMNSFDIPKGWVRTSDASAPLEYTEWAVIADLKNLRYYVKTYDNPTLQGIGIQDLQQYLDAKEIMAIPLKENVSISRISVTPVKVNLHQ